MLNRFRPALAVAALALLVLPAGASARSFAQTFPRAAALCAAVDAGTPPAAYAGVVTQVKAACTSLRNSHASAEAAFTAATGPLQPQISSIMANARAACADARASGNRAACTAAMRDAATALRPILQQWRAAARIHRAALATAGRAFWSTVRPLRGTTIVDPPPPVDPDPIGIT